MRPNTTGAVEPQRTHKHLISIQYLRALAALLVVAFHARGEGGWFDTPFANVNFGARGVDIFFVISGFVMYTAARLEKPSTFFQRRVVRVVPLYWLATGAFITVKFLIDGNGISKKSLVQSMLFIPFKNPSYSGEVWPLLVPGWTLNYEMVFYLIFGIGIALHRPVSFVLTLIPVLVLAGVAHPTSSAVWSTYTNPLMIEFAAGVIVGCLFARYRFGRVMALLPLGLAGLLLSDVLPGPKVIVAGLPALMIVVGALGFEDAHPFKGSPVVRLLGDASYSLYLIHCIVIEVMKYFWTMMNWSNLLGFSAFLALSIIVSGCLAVPTYRYLEKPLSAWLNALLRKPVA